MEFFSIVERNIVSMNESGSAIAKVARRFIVIADIRIHSPIVTCDS